MNIAFHLRVQGDAVVELSPRSSCSEKCKSPVWHESFSPQSTDLYFTTFENRVPQASGVLLWLHINMISYNSETDGDMDGKASVRF